MFCACALLPVGVTNKARRDKKNENSLKIQKPWRRAPPSMDDVGPNDSVSNAPSRRSSKSSMISIRMHLESEHAELAAKAERLQKKQHLEKK